MGMQLSPAYREVRTEIRSRDHRTLVRDPWGEASPATR
jgi:hypothetical protein